MNTRSKLFLSLLVFIILMLPLVFYATRFGFGLWSNHKMWSEMGTYLSGVYAPILSGITALFLFIQILVINKQVKIQEVQTDIQRIQLTTQFNESKKVIINNQLLFVNLAAFYEQTRLLIKNLLAERGDLELIEYKEKQKKLLKQIVEKGEGNIKCCSEIISDMKLIEVIWDGIDLDKSEEFRQIIANIWNNQNDDLSGVKSLFESMINIPEPLLMMTYKEGGIKKIEPESFLLPEELLSQPVNRNEDDFPYYNCYEKYEKNVFSLLEKLQVSINKQSKSERFSKKVTLYDDCSLLNVESLIDSFIKEHLIIKR